jgi:regulator of nucleoside diphosphate kinase
MNKTYLTHSDYQKILHFTDEARQDNILNEVDYLNLKTKLAASIIVGDESERTDIVKLNSVVNLKTPYGEISKLKVILSGKCTIDKNCASIITPLGTSLIGSSLGDTIGWKGGQRAMTFTIQSIQNE